MIGRAGVLDAAFSGAYRLIRKSLQPQDPRKKDARPRPPVDLKGNDLPTAWNDVSGETALQMPPGAFLVTQIMFRDACFSPSPICRSLGSPRFPARVRNLCASARAAEY